MTQQEELLYLTNLALEASKWRISEGDDTDCIRLEVQDRIRRLSGVDTVDSDGRCQSEPKKKYDDAEYKRRWTENKKETHVRTTVNGKTKWVKKEHAEKGPKSKGNGWRWCIKPEFLDLYK